jgi:plastocyanin
MRSITVLTTVTLLLLLTCGCTESPSAQPAATTTVTATPSPVITITSLAIFTPERTVSVSDNTITVIKNTFRPANMTLKAGSTVRWVNEDDHPHRIEFADKTFSTSTYLLGSGQSASQRFDHTGVYDYSCVIHPYMQGTITVEG